MKRLIACRCLSCTATPRKDKAADVIVLVCLYVLVVGLATYGLAEFLMRHMGGVP